MACREVLVLRTLSPTATRQRAVRRLLAKYTDGRRTAADVVEGLAALLAQLQYAEASALLNDALHAVRPVPTLLWGFACRQVQWLSVGALRQMLRLAARDPRLDRRLRPHRQELVLSVDGILALLYEGPWRFEWADELLRGAMGRLQHWALPPADRAVAQHDQGEPARSAASGDREGGRPSE